MQGGFWVCANSQLFFSRGATLEIALSVLLSVRNTSLKESYIKSHQASKSSVKIKCQNQVSKSSIKVKCQNQASKSSVKILLCSYLKYSVLTPSPPQVSIKIKHHLESSTFFAAILNEAFCPPPPSIQVSSRVPSICNPNSKSQKTSFYQAFLLRDF